MKTAKKLFSVLLAFVMVLALAVPAFAVGEDSDTTTGSITITNPIEGVTYTAYKIFDVTYNDDKTAYAYTIDSNDAWYSTVNTYAQTNSNELTLTQVGSTTTYNVSVSDSFSAASFAVALGTALKANTSGFSDTATALQSGTDEKPTANNLALGYYFVSNTSTATNALFSLDTTNPDVEIRDKNQLPQIEKEVAAEENGIYDNETSVSVGDTVYFQVTITTEAGTDADGNPVAQSYVLHDKMTDGLTFNSSSVTVTLNGIAVTNNTDYTVTTPGSEETDNACTFEVSFKEDFLKNLKAYDKIVISYSATVNGDAVTVDEVKNTATLNFGDNQKIDTEKDPTEIKTYSFDLIKTGPALGGEVDTGYYQVTDENSTTTYYNKLDGAKFKLYDAVTGGNEIVLMQRTDTEGNTYYRPATADEKTQAGFSAAVIEAGQATIKGLAAGTYYLEETEAPDGYNPLKARVEVIITDEDLSFSSVSNTNTLTGGIQVINETGTELPSTGGMGTTIFYVIGGVLVVAAIVLLVTRKRMNNAD